MVKAQAAPAVGASVRGWQWLSVSGETTTWTANKQSNTGCMLARPVCPTA